MLSLKCRTWFELVFYVKQGVINDSKYCESSWTFKIMFHRMIIPQSERHCSTRFHSHATNLTLKQVTHTSRRLLGPNCSCYSQTLLYIFKTCFYIKHIPRPGRFSRSVAMFTKVPGLDFSGSVGGRTPAVWTSKQHKPQWMGGWTAPYQRLGKLSLRRDGMDKVEELHLLFCFFFLMSQILQGSCSVSCENNLANKA